MLLDAKSKLWCQRGISPVVVTDNTPFVSQIFDLANFHSVMAAIAAGTLADADATFQVLVEDGNAANLSDAVAVDDLYLTGIEGVAATPTGASFTFAQDDAVRTIGYVGPKRYVRVTITPAANTGSAPIAMIWVGMGKRVGPNTSQSS